MFRRPARVMKDFMEVMNNETGFIRVLADENPSMKTFHVEIGGPIETPYFTGKFIVMVNVPPDFPMDPPKIKMVTPIWHPNISSSGKICVDFLEDTWCPGITLLESIEGIRGLLANPNADSPLNVEAGAMMRSDRATFDAVGVAFTCTFARGSITDAGIEEQISVLTALGMERGVALKKLAMTRCNTQRVIDMYINDL